MRLGKINELCYYAGLESEDAILTVRYPVKYRLRPNFNRGSDRRGTPAGASLCAVLLFSLLLPLAANASDITLDALTREREVLSDELQQYEKTLAILHTEDTPPETSKNPAVRTLAAEMVNIRQRLISITEQEVTLLQEQIVDARAETAPLTEETSPANPVSVAVEAKPQRPKAREYSVEQEARDVARLRGLLTAYYTEQQQAAQVLPTEEEVAQREAAQLDAQRLAMIPFSADKVRLNGSEGSTALSQITRRLSDPNLPESRRDVSPICTLKTRLFGKLVGSETRSLIPVGKHHYVARIRLQPGDTTLRIMDHRWELKLPEDISATEYLFTLYAPPSTEPELHVFAVNDLLAEEQAHIPAWLPDAIGLKPRAG